MLTVDKGIGLNTKEFCLWQLSKSYNHQQKVIKQSKISVHIC